MSENALYMSEMTEMSDNISRKGNVKQLETLNEPTLTNGSKLKTKPNALEAEPKLVPRRWWMI